mmetsp:Transcript_32163/g.48905  ORF Transcript_32163/g.48905 Transcript_32163/m.48905 type:complete len:204 (+) Transcript_32163:396-1007(+)
MSSSSSEESYMTFFLFECFGFCFPTFPSLPVHDLPRLFDKLVSSSFADTSPGAVGMWLSAVSSRDSLSLLLFISTSSPSGDSFGTFLAFSLSALRCFSRLTSLSTKESISSSSSSSSSLSISYSSSSSSTTNSLSSSSSLSLKLSLSSSSPDSNSFSSVEQERSDSSFSELFSVSLLFWKVLISLLPSSPDISSRNIALRTSP